MNKYFIHIRKSGEEGGHASEGELGGIYESLEEESDVRNVSKIQSEE